MERTERKEGLRYFALGASEAEAWLPQLTALDELIFPGHPWGEETFRKLTEYYLNQKEEEELYRIPGICFRRNEGTVNSGFPDVLDMDRLVFPYEDLSSFSHKILYYESSRGCPFSCSYCLSSVDKKLRFKSLDLVKKELEIFLEAKVPQVKFVDRTFNCREDHALEIWRYIQDHDNGVTNFHFEIGADLLTEKENQRLAFLQTR